MSFRTRSFQPVPPAERHTRSRSAVRLIVRSQGRVFLFRDTDPGLPGSTWWVTPGGGIDPGETERQCGVRELREETGQQVSEDALIGPIARREVRHGYSDQILVQRETFYAVDVDEFELDDSGWTDGERITLADHRWYSIPEVRQAMADGVRVWPEQLPDLFASDGTRCVDLGVQEESTVPVHDGWEAPHWPAEPSR